MPAVLSFLTAVRYCLVTAGSAFFGLTKDSGSTGAGSPSRRDDLRCPGIQQLIRKMAAENPTGAEERIANELMLKLGIRVSPQNVPK